MDWIDWIKNQYGQFNIFSFSVVKYGFCASWMANGCIRHELPEDPMLRKFGVLFSIK
jgi:hypothetical protein